MDQAMRSAEALDALATQVEARGGARESGVEARNPARESGVEARSLLQEDAADPRRSAVELRGGREPGPHAPRSAPEWNATVVADILGFEYARAVIFTDGQGRVLFCGGSRETAADTAEALDVALSALAQGGQALGMGELDVSVWLYRSGTVVAACSGGLRAVVLARANANLAQLLSHIRRIFAGRHE
jgi:hypothetical protein